MADGIARAGVELYPELQPIAAALPRYDFATVGAVRAQAAALGAVLRKAPHVKRLETLVEVSDLVVEREAGPMSVRCYRPRGDIGSPWTMIYYHGGGFMIGDLDFEHHRCLQLALRVPCNVISCDYRLCPEWPFPAAFIDCYDAYLWGEAFSRSRLGTANVLIGGASCGGALAAGVCLRLRDEGRPLPAVQMLVYPVLDNAMGTLSMRRASGTPGWSREANEHMWRNYLAGPHDLPEYYACPGRAPELAGLPPTYLMAAQMDPLRDEGLDFAVRLIRAGVPVELRHYALTFHGFDSLQGVEVAEDAMEDQVRAIRRLAGSRRSMKSAGEGAWDAR